MHDTQLLSHIMLLENSFNLDIKKLTRLYETQLENHNSANWEATFRPLITASVLLTASILMFVFSSMKYHFVPWNFLSGITGLYYLIICIKGHRKGTLESKNTRTEIATYLEGLEQVKSILYKVSETEIEYFKNEKHKITICWSDLISLVDKESYFYLIFRDENHNILIPKFAVTSDFYNDFLQFAKRNVR